MSAGYVAGYLGGKYVIRYFDIDKQETRYTAVGENEMFG